MHWHCLAQQRHCTVWRGNVSFFFFQAEDGIRDGHVTGVQTCALPISASRVTYTRSFPSGVTRSMSALSGITYALSGSAGSSASGKPKSDGSPSAMLVHDSP